MAYEQRDGDIAIFAEQDKKNEKAPDWKGTMVLNGQKLEVALWAKGGRGTMLAGSVKPAREQQQRGDDFRSGSPGGGGDGGFSGGDRDVAQRGFSADLDDEIPFVTRWSLR